jgi:hypothetical protein
MKTIRNAALVMAPLSCLLLANTLCAFAADDPVPSTTPASSQPVVKTPLRIDPAHPLRIGDAYYPADSKRLGEHGRCLVKVTVQADGSTRDVSLAQSSGYPRLDEAGFIDDRSRLLCHAQWYTNEGSRVPTQGRRSRPRPAPDVPDRAKGYPWPV